MRPSSLNSAATVSLTSLVVYRHKMDRDVAIAEIAQFSDALKARGAAAAYLFGSTARDEAKPDSDLDIFIDPAPNRKFSLIDLAGIQNFLQGELNRPVDVTTRNSLHPRLKAEIEREALRVF
jgi:uncharacterized protein